MLLLCLLALWSFALCPRILYKVWKWCAFGSIHQVYDGIKHIKTCQMLNIIHHVWHVLEKLDGTLLHFVPKVYSYSCWLCALQYICSVALNLSALKNENVSLDMKTSSTPGLWLDQILEYKFNWTKLFGASNIIIKGILSIPIRIRNIYCFPMSMTVM